MRRQKLDKNKFVAALAITTLIFIAGIFAGNYFSAKKLDQIDTIGQNLRTDTLAIELQYDLIAENPCSSVNSTPLAEELYELASKLDYMENRLGENNQNVLRLKEYYSLLELRHWLFMKKTNKECGNNNTLILYFYSNDADCRQCEEQGFILTWLRKTYPHVYIYAFDTNIENPALETIKIQHDVQSVPSVVFNQKTYNTFMKKDTLVNLVHSAFPKKNETKEI